MIMGELIFTPAAVLDLLSQIDELQPYNIEIVDGVGDTLQITIGDSVYRISNTGITDIVVDGDTVSDVEDVNQSTYDALIDADTIQLEPIQSGLIKELAKTLFVGGLVRLTTKLIK